MSIQQRITDNLAQNGVAQGKPGLIEEVNDDNNKVVDDLSLRDEILSMLDVPHGQRRLVDTETKIQAIIDWAKKSALSDSKNDILGVIQTHVQGFGWQMNADKLEKVYKYTRLNDIRHSIIDPIGDKL